MKNSNEMLNSLFERRDKYIAEQEIKRKINMKIAVSVCSLCLVAIAGFGIWQSGNFKTTLKPTDNIQGTVQPTENDKSNNTPTTDIGIIQNNDQQTPGNDTPTNDGNGDFYSVGGFMIPYPPQSNSITFTGEKITDEEAAAYFSENKVSIVSSLSSSGVAADNIKISEHGYCFISYDGTEGKGLEVRQNFRNYLVYNGNRLIAIITLAKENGELSNTVSFGAKWFDGYNKFLQAHAGQKLIYVYANTEIVIAPDGSYVSPMGYDVSDYLNWSKNPYEWFYSENVVFIP